jgi:DNA-binding response OmpR family regulator
MTQIEHRDTPGTVLTRLRATPAHILIVEDDPDMRNVLTDYLTRHNLRVTAASDGQQARMLSGRGDIDLAIVDLNLGREDGLPVVRDLADSRLPVIIITGKRVEEADKVVGLEIGAVDYLTKPFGMRELLARIRTRLRRRSARARSAAKGIYLFSNYTFDLDERRLVRGGSEDIQMSAREFNLLAVLVRLPRQTLSREFLLSESRMRTDGVFDRSIDVAILRLRRRLDADPTQPGLIRTVRNAGYVFDTDVTLRTESP